jgi:choline dehydrogenase-like flavoprotein
LKVMVCAEQLPDWDNRIGLSRQRDRLGSLKALLTWKPMPSEERSLRATVVQLTSFWQSLGLASTCKLILTPSAVDTLNPLTDSAEACAHPSGTTRMGTNPANSVVAEDLACHAVPNVSVVSASVFPTAGSANPTFTIMKLAYLFADSYLAKVCFLEQPSVAPRGISAYRPN